ncbi:MAG: 50S ribosomal protein L3 [Syntrophobacterales bacterium]|jgi:large subunit ribosomal protein L3|nr:50S ribosomal protein L3 [Syntrophobacterales bacterium]
MGIGLLGRKLGMTQIFGEDGSAIPVTVIKAGPCAVVQKKTVSGDGYDGIQLGFEEIEKVKRVNKPANGHFKKANVLPRALLREFRVDAEGLEAYELGGEISVEIFEPGEFVDVTGTSKGKGFAGVVKRHHFKGAPASRGTHEFFRHGGSIGQNMTPGRTIKGKKMPGHMGSKRVTVQNLKVIDVRGDTNILMVEGAIPGPSNGFVIIKKAVKK